MSEQPDANDPVRLSLAAAESALAPLVKAMQARGDFDAHAVASLLETVGMRQEFGTMIAFTWALIRRLREEWEAQ